MTGANEQRHQIAKASQETHHNSKGIQDLSPRVEEDEGWRHKRSSEDRAEILNYVVTIRRNNILWIAFFVHDLLL
jgi:hypothetical protein